MRSPITFEQTYRNLGSRMLGLACIVSYSYPRSVWSYRGKTWLLSRSRQGSTNRKVGPRGQRKIF